VAVSGTTNTVVKFTSSSTIGNSNITDTGSLITLGSNSYVNGNLGVGTTSPSTYSLAVVKNMTGGTLVYGVGSYGTIQSDVTSGANGFISGLITAAASFTLTNYRHFYANQGTIGAGSVVTNQTAFFVDSNVIGATNNYAFRSVIPAGANNWNLFMDGTANNYLAGSLGIGNTSLDTTMLRISRAFTSTLATSIFLDSQISSTNTSATYIATSANTQAATFTTTIRHISLVQGTFGAGSTVTDQYGVLVGDLTGATNNYGFFGNISAATNRWNLYMGGTAANYMAGSLGIGTNALTGVNLNLGKIITGATIAYNMYNNSTINSDVVNAYMFRTLPSTQAASFVLNQLNHYVVSFSSIGAGSSINTQHGFWVDTTMVGATNNYGFRGSIPSATGRWNLYMDGTAANYMAGQLLIGTTNVLADYPLNVQGTVNGNLLMRFANTSNGTSARMGLILSTDFGALGSLDAFSTTYNLGSTDDTANGIRLFASGAGGLSLRASNASSTIRFYNGSTESARFGTNGALGLGTGSSINASARLQVDSTTQGFLPPRMTSAQRTAIASPATGLIVYQTDGVEGLWLRTSTGWVELTVV
jgi:hypothetical protein